ncbi:MAG: hypothetical protein ACJAUZ_002385 [Flavobacteriaceae bacterium]|jgi:hypothetical protein
MTTIKLSPAQLELLKEQNGSCVERYKPYLKLLELGLINSHKTTYNVKWEINANGKQFLASLESQE